MRKSFFPKHGDLQFAGNDSVLFVPSSGSHFAQNTYNLKSFPCHVAQVRYCAPLEKRGRRKQSSCTYTCVPIVCVLSLAVAFLCTVPGLLNPLDSPHHMRVDEDSEYREGVVLDRPSKPGRGSFVNCGMKKVWQRVACRSQNNLPWPSVLFETGAVGYRYCWISEHPAS